MQNTYVAYFEHVTITYKVWHGLDQRGPVPSHHNIPFSHKNIQNHFIYDIPCLNFDLLRSVLGTLMFFLLPHLDLLQYENNIFESSANKNKFR
jgi:hypothetical protein